MKQETSTNIQSNIKTVSRNKVVSITILYICSIAVILSGIVFGVVSIVNKVNFKVFSSEIPASVFAAVVIFLGFRYFLSVNKLREEVFKDSSKFSWSNFKRDKPRKGYQ